MSDNQNEIETLKDRIAELEVELEYAKEECDGLYCQNMIKDDEIRRLQLRVKGLLACIR